MKRSRNVILTGTMVAVAVAGCDNIDNRTYQNTPYDNKTSAFDVMADKRLKVTCDKPEDFSMPECHKQGAQTQNQPRTHTGFIFLHYPWLYNSSNYNYNSGYGSSTRSARAYASARTAVNTSGLTGYYRTAAVPKTTMFSRMGSLGRAMSSRVSTANATRAMSSAITVSRSSIGSFGRASIAASSAS